jgi:hypothetical protein
MWRHRRIDMKNEAVRKLSAAADAIADAVLGGGVILAADHVRDVRNDRIATESSRSDGRTSRSDSARALSMCP